MGVITNGYIPRGRAYGPIPKGLTLVDPLYLIGHMASDNRTNVHTVKLEPRQLEDLVSAVDWVPYLQAAREEHEQNLEATLIGGDLHYRSIRDIDPGEELLVWYDLDLNRRLQLPEMQSIFMEGPSAYICPYCQEKFRFPNPIRAHIRFKCAVLRQYFFGCGTGQFLEQKNAFLSKHLSITTDESTKLRMSPESDSPSPPTLKHSPTGESILGKRSRLDNVTHSPKYAKTDNGKIENRISPSRLDLNQNLKLEKSSETGSAFRKVCGSPSSPRSHGVSSDILSSQNSPPLVTPAALNLTKSNLNLSSPPSSQPLNGLSHMNAIQSRVMPSLSNQHLPSELGLQGLSMKQFNLNGHHDKLSMMGTDMLSQMSPRVPMYPSMNMHAPAPYMKSQNPMVEKLLHAGSIGLPSSMGMTLQNWCAKCNATFRMTSDLVYHMRTHHKLERDPVKPRAEKLRCSICGESFKERHHLTRHMTSHE